MWCIVWLKWLLMMRLQAHIRSHALHLLNIKETAYLCDPVFYLPPSDDDLKAFKEQAPHSIDITPQNFRLDLHQSRQSLFNWCAKEVFAHDFIRRVTQDKWYSFPPIPEKYLVTNYVEYTFHGQIKHLMRVYKATDATARGKHLWLVAIHNRKWTVGGFYLSVCCLSDLGTVIPISSKSVEGDPGLPSATLRETRYAGHERGRVFSWWDFNEEICKPEDFMVQHEPHILSLAIGRSRSRKSDIIISERTPLEFVITLHNLLSTKMHRRLQGCQSTAMIMGGTCHSETLRYKISPQTCRSMISPFRCKRERQKWLNEKA